MRARKLLRRVMILSATTICFAAARSSARATSSGPDEFTSLLHRGFDLHQRADYTDALPLLRQAWKLDPGDYFVNLLLGIDLLRTRKAEEAILFLRTAIRARPTEDFPYEYAAEAEASLGHYADAAEFYLHALAVNPQSAEAIEAWGDYSLERFRRLAGQLRSTQPGLAAEYRLQARSYPAAETKRRELLQQSAALDSKAPGVWSELALADLACNDAVAAKRNADEAIAEDASDLRAMEAQALLSARAGDWKQAAGLLDAIADRSPGLLVRAAADWPPALQPNAGTVIHGAAEKFLACVSGGLSQRCAVKTFQTHTPPAARNDSSAMASAFREQRWDRLSALPEPVVTKLKSSRPGSPAMEAWFFKGVALAQLGQCDRAIPALERGVLIDPGLKSVALNSRDPEGFSGRMEPLVYARFLLSWCYADVAGRIDASVSQAGGDTAISHMIRGDVLLRMQGNTAGAIREYEAALAVRGDDPKLLERLAEAQVSAGLFDGASRNAQAALLIDPQRYSARQTLARVAMEQGKYEEAIPRLWQLAAVDSHDESTQISLATALSQTGNPSEALDHLQPLLRRGYPDAKGSLHSLLGTLLRRVGRPDEATQAFAAARQLSEDYQRSNHRDQDASQ